MKERTEPGHEDLPPSGDDADARQVRAVWPAGSAVAVESAGWLYLLMQEYGRLQTIIDKFDGQRFQIRNWSIAVVGVLFTASVSTKLSLIAFAGVVTTLFFAFLEFICMQQTAGVIDRSDELEEFIKAYRVTGLEPSGYVFGVGKAFEGVLSLKRLPETVFASGRSHMNVFYIGLMAVAAAGGLAVALH